MRPALTVARSRIAAASAQWITAAAASPKALALQAPPTITRSDDFRRRGTPAFEWMTGLQPGAFRASIMGVTPARRALLGVLACLPTIGVLTLAIASTVITHDRADQLVELAGVVVWLPGMTLEEAIALGIATIVVALVQIGVAIPLIMHAQKNERLSPGQRTLWTMLVLLVGSICAPLYWSTHVRVDR